MSLKDSDAERIKRQLDQTNHQRLRDAVQTVWERLFAVVDNFAERMDDGGGSRRPPWSTCKNWPLPSRR